MSKIVIINVPDQNLCIVPTFALLTLTHFFMIANFVVTFDYYYNQTIIIIDDYYNHK